MAKKRKPPVTVRPASRSVPEAFVLPLGDTPDWRDGLFDKYLMNTRTNDTRRTRIVLDKWGTDKFMRYAVASKVAQIVAKDQYGVLWRVILPAETEVFQAVEVQDASPDPETGDFKRYFLRVPPDVKTAHEAVAWTFGKSVADYHPSRES